MATQTKPSTESALQEIPLNKIHVDSNYRETFDEGALNELAMSIKENGVIEPIIVRPNKSGFAIVAGERRYRASILAGTATIPAIVRDLTDHEVLKIQIVENVQRVGVPFMEEAYGLQRLRDELSLDVTEMVKLVGRSDAWIYQMLSLTRMHGEAQRLAKNGFLTKPVACLIARLSDPEDQSKAANELARTQKGKLVDIRFARQYVETKIEANGKPLRKKRNAIQKQNGDDYIANWKKYLLTFSYDEFERFKAIVRGRTQTDILAEAVDLVMRRRNDDVGGGVMVMLSHLIIEFRLALSANV